MRAVLQPAALRIWLALWAALWFAPAARAQPPIEHRILLLHSHNPLVHSTLMQDRAIRSGIDQAIAGHVEFHPEHLLGLDLSDESSVAALRDYLRLKYRRYPIDLVITTDTLAAKFWAAHREEILPDHPWVFSGLNDHERSAIASLSNATGTIERIPYRETIALMRRLHPKSSTLVLINGWEGEQAAFRALVEPALAQSPGWDRVVWMEQRTHEEYTAACADLPSDAVGLLVSHVPGVSRSDLYRPAVALPAPGGRPLYAVYRSSVLPGYVGGFVIDADRGAAAAARLAVRVLSGEPIGALPADESSAIAPVFDAEGLHRWGIRRADVPSGAVVLNEPPPLLSRAWARWTLAAVAGAAFGGAAVSIILAARRRREVASARAREDRLSAERVARLLESASQLLGATHEREVAQRVADAVHGAGWGQVGVYLYRPDWTVLDVVYAGCSDERIAQYERTRPTPEVRRRLFGPEHARFRLSRSLFIPAEALAELGLDRHVVAGRDGSTWRALDVALIPLTDLSGAVIGSISLGDPADGRRPTEPDYRQLEFFADLASRAIELLRVIESARRAASEARRAGDTLARLLRAAQSLQSASDESQVLSAAAGAIHESGWGCVTAYSYNPDWTIRRVAYAGLSPDMIAYMETHRLTPERRRGMFGPEMDRFRVSRSYLVPTESVPELNIPFDIMTGRRAAQPGDTWRPKDLAYIPLRATDGTVIGRLTLDDPDDGQRPSEAQYARLEFFADLAARAIENLRLLERVRAAAEETRRSAEMLRTVVNNSPLVLWAADAEGNFTLSEGMGLRGFDLAPGEVVGTSVWDFVRDSPAAAEQIRRALAGGTFSEPVHIAGLTFETYFAPVHDDSGAIVGMMGVSTDVTERSRVRAELEESTARFTEFARKVDQVLWLEDLDPRRITFVNPAFERIWGIPMAELYADFGVWARSVHPEDLPYAQHVFEQWIAQVPGAEYDVEYRIIRRDGQVRWIHDRGVSIKNAEGRIARVAGVATDITARKKAALDLQRESELRRLLLSELDHRVKNALSGLLSMIDLSKDRRDEHAVPAIHARVQAMLTVHSMLSSSHWSSVNLMRLLSSMVPPTLGDRAAFSGPEVDIPARQATALGMVIQELMTNCQKHGAFSSAAGRLEVTWSLSRPDPLDAHRLTLRWTERAGPRPASPVVDGTGTGLVHGFARFELRGEARLTYPEEGADHTLIIGLDHDTPPINPISSSDTSLTNELAALGSHI